MATKLASVPAAGESGQVLSSRVSIAAILAFAVLSRAVYWNQRPPDMRIFLEPWMNHIVHYGPIAAFGHPFSNYEPAYLYLLALGSLAHGFLATMTIIKILSVAGSVFLTFALADLLKAAGVQARAALLALVLPSVVINDALLGQCDALWAGACIFALGAMIRGQTVSSLVWCGVAISFKALAVFIAPVIIGALIGRRAPLWQWGIPAVAFLATLLLPWLLGWPAYELLTVYLGQATIEPLIAGRLGNPWMLMTIFADAQARHFYWIGLGAALGAGMIIGALAKRGWRDPQFLILLAALSGTVLPFLLPKMLERYYFLGDVMTLALALTLRNRNATIAVLAVQMASILSHMTYLYSFEHPWPSLIGAVAAAVGIVAMCSLAARNFDSLVSDLPLLKRWSSSAAPQRPASDGRTTA
jgi:Gpi18-like mannosyltransferase